MKYLKTFNAHTNYESFIKTPEFIRPNVSYCKTESEVHFNPFRLDGNIGDVVVASNGKLKVVTVDNVGNDTPVGIIVIPSKFSFDGKARMMSLVEMSPTSPETGVALEHTTSSGASLNSLYWGGYNFDVAELPNAKAIKNEDNTYYDGMIYYYKEDGTKSSSATTANTSPSLFLNGELNLAIDTTSEYLTKSVVTAYNAFYKDVYNGELNTQKLINIQTTVWDGDTLTNDSNTEGNHPAACACRRFHTEGTIAGEWYLPSIYELFFVASKTDTIQGVLTELKLKGANPLILNEAPYWSSTEFSSAYAWDWSPGGSNLSGTNKDSTGLVRSFRAL